MCVHTATYYHACISPLLLSKQNKRDSHNNKRYINVLYLAREIETYEVTKIE